jgi:phospholipid/cholesterol/gamma-HCH transport system substrate-binding protein
MGTPRQKPAAVFLAIGFAISCFLLTLLVWRSFGGGVPFEAQGYRFHVLFGAEASQVSRGADVRISGVPVGRVTGTETSRRNIDVEIELDQRYAPIPADTRAIVRYKTLLGESFIALTPGNEDGPELADEGTLDRSQVEPTVQIDEVLSVFDRHTRDDFRHFLVDLSRALEGRGESFSNATGNAAPTFEDLSRVVGVLDRERPAVRRIIRDGGLALAAIGSRQAELQELVTAGDAVLSATAARNRALTASVRAFPPFLTELRETLPAVEQTAAEAEPILSRLRPAAPLLRPALEGVERLSPQLGGLLRDIDPLIPLANRGLPAASRILKAARPLVRVLYPAGRELAPVVDYTSLYRREIVGGIANAASATQGGIRLADGSLRRYVRVVPPITSEQLFGYPKKLRGYRFNPYHAPGSLANVGAGGLMSFDCRETGDLQVEPGPRPRPVPGMPCIVQPPWTFQGEARSYAHVERDRP